MCVEEEWTGVPHTRHTASAKSLLKVHVLHADMVVFFSEGMHIVWVCLFIF